MKDILLIIAAMVCVVCIGIYSSEKHDQIEAKESMYLHSLHYTAKGMGHWYSKENGGLELITGIHYDNLSCKNCHVEGCDTCHKEENEGKASYSVKAAKNQDMCLKCHGREGLIMKIDREAKQEDVHFLQDMKCFDCHSAKEMHGDGIEYNSMRQDNAMDTQCENCHDDVKRTSSHTAHKDKLDCKACHIRHVVSCANCHFDTSVKKGERVSVPLSGWVFLINHRGKVTSGNMQTFVAKGNKTFMIFAPHMSHSVTKEGRKCAECHGTQTVKQAREGEVTLTWLDKDGNMQNLKEVIPVAEGVKYQSAYLDRKGDKWVPIQNPSQPIIQYPAFGKPLTKEQLEKLIKVYDMPPFKTD